MEPHAKRQSSEFRRTFLEIIKYVLFFHSMCSRRPGVRMFHACFFPKFPRAKQVFCYTISGWKTSILSVAEEFGGSEVSFDKVKHPQLLAEMEERQNNLREPVYTEEIQWLSIFSFLKCKVFSVHVPFSPDSLLFVTVFFKTIYRLVSQILIFLQLAMILLYI